MIVFMWNSDLMIASSLFFKKWQVYKMQISNGQKDNEIWEGEWNDKIKLKNDYRGGATVRLQLIKFCD